MQAADAGVNNFPMVTIRPGTELLISDHRSPP